MEPQWIAIALGCLAVGGGLGLLLGRRRAGDAPRIHELEQQVEELRKEREGTLAQLEEAREDVKRAEAHFQEYEGEVVEHFSGTSDLLRDLTIQYRSVVSHLTDGVGKLCPEGALEIHEGLRVAALPPAVEDEAEVEEQAIETSPVDPPRPS